MSDAAHNPSPAAPRVSIVVATYNSLTYLQGLLASIAVYTPQDRYELIVVDNASTDETAQWCLYAPLGIHLILNHENRGFAAAANAGAALAKGEFLLFCNPDVRWTSPVADRLMEFMEAHPSCGLAAARLTFPDRRFQPSCRNFPTFTNIWFSRGSILSRLANPAAGAFQYTLGDFEHSARVDAVAATCVLIRRKVFTELGGFDERFFLFAEDTDLCRRSNEAGYETWYVPAASAIHHWGGSSRDHRSVARHHAQSIARYFKKHYPRARMRNLLLSLILFVAGRLSGSARFKARSGNASS